MYGIEESKINIQISYNNKFGEIINHNQNKNRGMVNVVTK